MRISAVVMSHPARKEYADKLYSQLSSQGFYETGIVYDENNNEWGTGQRALRTHTDSDYVCIIQDDAIISDNFYENALQAILNVPEPTLLSFYTGTVRPYRSKFIRAVNKARIENASYLSYNTLCWGVAFAIPTKDIETVLEAVKHSRLAYDWRIGSYYARTRKQVYYTYPSIADHDWTIPSILGHDKRCGKRVAHVYEAGVVNFNGKVVKVV